jgi:two-component system, sensor histidine kinase and response regulator
MERGVSQPAEVQVLAVDDVAENLTALEALLVQPGLRLLKATSGTEALELLLGHEVALALIDVQMPGMSGFELAELMRGSDRTRSVPIIFLTAGTAEHGRVFRGYEAGAVDFLFKPIDPQLLRGKVSVFVELFRQRLMLEAQVAEHRKLLRTSELLIGVLGHDLRNPLNAIHLAGEALLRAYPRDETITKLGGRIRSSSQRMGRLIAQLLDFATTRLGNLPVQPKETDLRHLSESAVGEFEQLQGAALQHHVEGDPCGTWDPDRILQLLSNLLGNALQHGDPTEPIVLRIDGREPDVVHIEVESGGVLPESVRDNLFAPFVRASETSGGAGLGLYIVHHIARAHGGTMDAESSAGRTVFRARLPRHHRPER